MRLLSPRRRGSSWSPANRTRAEQLIAKGLMTAAGLAKIEQAKADGSWLRLRALENLESFADLDEALERSPPARAHFLAFPPSARRAILEWILQARRPETRRRRVEEAARLAACGLRANQPRQPKGARP